MVPTLLWTGHTQGLKVVSARSKSGREGTEDSRGCRRQERGVNGNGYAKRRLNTSRRPLHVKGFVWFNKRMMRIDHF
jgi:hypothetical protein